MAKRNDQEAPLHRVVVVAYRRALSPACATRVVQEELAGRDFHVHDDAALAETACGNDVEMPELCGSFHRTVVEYDGTNYVTRQEVTV